MMTDILVAFCSALAAIIFLSPFYLMLIALKKIHDCELEQNHENYKVRLKELSEETDRKFSQKFEKPA